MFKIPVYITEILKRIEASGYEAFLVGGCVRDYIMGKKPDDYDIASSAHPDEIKAIFSDFKTIDTGIKHGTVSIFFEGNVTEITTFRIDGKYKDSRRPESIAFTNSIEEDLKRRDFAVNAMAMDLRGNITDPFGGQEDIKRKVIRAVGNAQKRFEEDALRILRGVRFASVLDFEIEKETAVQIHLLRERLKNISSERIKTEFVKLLCGKNVVNALREYSDVISVFIPEVALCIGFQQHSRYHKYDVYEHIIHAVEEVPNDDYITRTAMFFHDIAKPECFTMDERGGHFKGHAAKSSEYARAIMKRLRFSRKEINTVSNLVFYHRNRFISRKEIKEVLADLGEKNFMRLMDIQRADSLSKNDFCIKETDHIDSIRNQAKEILKYNECISIDQMDINGSQLADIGFNGKEIGKVLRQLLELIIEEKLENNRENLINCAKSIYKYHN